MGITRDSVMDVISILKSNEQPKPVTVYASRREWEDNKSFSKEDLDKAVIKENGFIGHKGSIECYLRNSLWEYKN